MRTPQLFFEQIFLRERTREEAGIRKADLSDGSLDEKLSAIEKSNEEILSMYSADSMREAVMRKMAARVAPDGDSAAGEKTGAKTGRAPLRFRAFAAMAAAAACLAVAVFVAIPKGAETFGTSGLLASADRAKGDGPRLFIYLKDGNNAILLENNAKVKENDVLQMSYIAAGQQYGAIFSIDGNGTVTWHYPDGGASAAKLENKGEIALPFSYQLDNAPDFERFFFISGQKPFTFASFIENIRIRSRIGDLQTADLTMIVPPGTRLTELTLIK